MLSLLIFSLLLVSLYILERTISLHRNLKLASETKLPYIIVPIYTGTPLWYLFYNNILSAFRRLPSRWTSPWLDYLDPYWSWKFHYEPFARLGSDTIIIVSPGGLQFCTCDPDVIVEVASRRNDFCKPVESYVYLDIFGPSLITREGKSWRAHQRMLAPTFTERNAMLVWDEAIAQAVGMLKSWCDHQNEGTRCIPDIREDTMTLPFHVINKAGFGVDLPWSSNGTHLNHASEVASADRIGSGHSMTYRDALHSTMNHLFHIVIFPSWLLRIAPFEYTKFLHTAHKETVSYLKELMVMKESELTKHSDGAVQKPGFDLMSSLISTRIQHEEAIAHKGDSGSDGDKEALTEQAILANVFLMMIAGHETTAHTLLITLLHLAIHLNWQKEVQKDLDQIFGDRSHDQWQLQIDCPLLSDGTVGATVNEVLRLWPPANIIPKGTRAGSFQTIKTSSYEFTIPENSALQFHVVSAHHHPKYWPSGPSVAGYKDDLNEFRPQRWLPKVGAASSHSAQTIQCNSKQLENTKEDFLSSQTPSALFKPHPGAFLAFSTGHRGCIGRRFAQVEMLAVIAVIFRDYSLELDVEKFAGDDTVESMTTEERKVVYEKAKSDIQRMMRDGIKHHLTMQLKGGRLAVRLVKRGKERFSQAYEETEM